MSADTQDLLRAWVEAGRRLGLASEPDGAAAGGSAATPGTEGEP